MIKKEEIEQALQDKSVITAVCFEANYWNIDSLKWEAKNFVGNGLNIWETFQNCMSFLDSFLPNVEDDDNEYRFYFDKHYCIATIWFMDNSWISTEYIPNDYDGDMVLIYHKIPQIPEV